MIEAGVVPYREAEERQRELVRRRQTGEIGDVLVLLEHPPVVTLGRNAKAEHLLRTREQLAASGIELAECDRGGDVTFHQPGQLVGYPVFDLRACRRPAFLPPRTSGVLRLELGPVDFVRALEEVLIRVLGICGLEARRIPGLTGVWTEAEAAAAPLAARAPQSSANGLPSQRHTDGSAAARKLAAIGVHVSRGVTSHGFALNVNNDLSGFNLIVPCGISDRGVSSLVKETGVAWTPAQVIPLVREQFLEIFGRELAPAPVSWDH